jgi:outer membrane protein insertion porin family
VIGASAGIPNQYFIYRHSFGAASQSLPLTVGWARDGRDSALAPTRGRLMRANAELSIAGDVRYARFGGQVQQYIPLGPKFTLGLNGEFAAGKGFGDRPYPVFKNYYGGGLGSVRVFEQSSLGRIDPTGAYIGGSRKFNVNAELYVPVPGSGNDKTLRIFGFTDAGAVWDEDSSAAERSVRVSAGVGVSWLSPMGPLRMSWGVPVRYQPDDRIQRFQFQIGTAF